MKKFTDWHRLLLKFDELRASDAVAALVLFAFTLVVVIFAASMIFGVFIK